MRVLYTLLSEDAGELPDGRIDVHGIFNELYALGFPAMHPMTVVLGIEWEPADYGSQELRVDILDPDQSPTGTIVMQYNVQPRHEAGLPTRTTAIIPLDEVRFPVEGRYEFSLQWNDRTVPLVPLHVAQQPESD